MAKKKKKRKVTNKTRDMLADYYKTNKATSEENRRRQEEEGTEKNKGLKNLNTMEKTCVIIIVLGCIGIFIRYFVLHI